MFLSLAQKRKNPLKKELSLGIFTLLNEELRETKNAWKLNKKMIRLLIYREKRSLMFS